MKISAKIKKLWILTMTLALSWLVVTGCSSTPDNSWSAAANYEEIALWHNGSQVVPASTTLSAGKSYKFTITPEKDGIGCMSTIKREWTQWWDVVMAWRDIEMVIDNAQPWTYNFVCNGMDMKQGSIVIEA